MRRDFLHQINSPSTSRRQEVSCTPSARGIRAPDSSTRTRPKPSALKCLQSLSERRAHHAQEFRALRVSFCGRFPEYVHTPATVAAGKLQDQSAQRRKPFRHFRIGAPAEARAASCGVSGTAWPGEWHRIKTRRTDQHIF